VATGGAVLMEAEASPTRTAIDAVYERQLARIVRLNLDGGLLSYLSRPETEYFPGA
jgi:hypothetical protein